MIVFDATRFLGAMKELKKEVPVEIDQLMSWQMALWVRDIIKKIAADPGKSLAEQRRAGMGAVSLDIGKVFDPLKTSSKVYDTNQKKSKNVYGMPLVKTEKGGLYLIDPQHDARSADMAALSEIHKKYRNSYGRVKHELRSTQKVKGLTVQGKYVVKENMLKRYVKEVQKRVGRTKACWINGLGYFESRSKGIAEWMPPNWITNHTSSVGAYSAASSYVNQADMTGSWEAGSRMAYGKNPRGTIQATGETRMKDLRGGWAAKRLQKVFDKHKAA